MGFFLPVNTGHDDPVDLELIEDSQRFHPDFPVEAGTEITLLCHLVGIQNFGLPHMGSRGVASGGSQMVRLP